MGKRNGGFPFSVNLAFLPPFETTLAQSFFHSKFLTSENKAIARSITSGLGVRSSKTSPHNNTQSAPSLAANLNASRHCKNESSLLSVSHEKPRCVSEKMASFISRGRSEKY